jgi:hypothetical protein
MVSTTPNSTAVLMARATTLHAEIAEACADSRALLDRSLARRRRPPLLVIRGGSDAVLITPLIADARLCLHCIARKTGVSVERVNAVLRMVAQTLRLRIGPHRCDACLEHKTTFSVTRDGHP